jgi:hypothetical protein
MQPHERALAAQMRRRLQDLIRPAMSTNGKASYFLLACSYLNRAFKKTPSKMTLQTLAFMRDFFV